MKNVIYQHETILSIPYYLRIEGGEGHGKKEYGGTYKFVAGYFHPTQLDDRKGQSLEKWCEIKGLPFLTANNFDELFEKLETYKPIYIGLRL